MNDDFGDRMKSYEAVETERRFRPNLPFMVRMDGHNFHALTLNLKRPYDINFASAMQETAKILLAEVSANVAYVRSDEITLCFRRPEIYWGGRIFKIVSHLSALTSVVFGKQLERCGYTSLVARLPTFDARAWQIPDLSEAVNTFLWREHDAHRNAIQMATRAVYSHAEVNNKDSQQMLAMLQDKQIDFDAYPNWFKHGRYYRRSTIFRPFTICELNDLPPKHNARNNPTLAVERVITKQLSVPADATHEQRLALLFDL